MAALTAEVTDITVTGPAQIELTVRRGSDEMRYRFRQLYGPPLPAVDYDFQFQKDFSNEFERFSAILGIAKRALRGEVPRLPVRLPDEPAAPGP